MNNMELCVLTDLTLFPQLIEFNYDELKTWLSGRLSQYAGLVVTEDAIKEAKADKARLNKLAKLIDDERKAIKAKCLAPYESFEEKTKELIGMISSVSSGIKGQLDAFDEKRKREKFSAIKAHFDEVVCDLSGLVSLESVIPKKWANVTEPLHIVTAEIDSRLDKIERDLDVMRARGGGHVQACINAYLKTLDLTSAFSELARLEAQAAALAERERRRAEASAPVEHTPPTEVIAEPTPPRNNTTEIGAPEDRARERIYFWVDVYPEEKPEIRDFFMSRNIPYGKARVAV